MQEAAGRSTLNPGLNLFAGICKNPLERIGELFAIEDDIRGRTPQERLAARTEQSAPLLSQMKLGFEETISKISRNWSFANFAETA